MSYDMSNSIDTLLPGIIPDPEIPVFTLTEGVARDKRTVDNYSFTLGALHALSELFTILVDVGARYTASDGKLRYITPPPVQSLNPDVKSDDDGLGSIGQITVSYADEKNTVSFVAYRDITAVGGSYGTTERTSFAISGGRRITDELSCNFSVTYYWNQSEAGELSRQEVDEETYVITPSLRYTLTDTIDLETQWQYVNNEDQEDDSEADRSLVFLRLVYEFPLID